MNKRLMPLWIVAALGVGFFAGRWTLPGHAGDAPPPPPIDADVKVVRISSGDSVEVSSLRHTDVHDKVRLIGIDAPASGKRWYEQSSKSLAELVKDKEVHLEFEEPGRVQRDKYNRVLAYIMVGDTNVSVEMLRRGDSELSTKHGGARFAEELRTAQDEAKAAKRGLWQVH